MRVIKLLYFDEHLRACPSFGLWLRLLCLILRRLSSCSWYIYLRSTQHAWQRQLRSLIWRRLSLFDCQILNLLTIQHKSFSSSGSLLKLLLLGASHRWILPRGVKPSSCHYVLDILVDLWHSRAIVLLVIFIWILSYDIIKSNSSSRHARGL